MTRECSLNSKKNTSSEHVVNKYCFESQNKNKKTIFVHNMFWTCIFLGIQWTISCHISDTDLPVQCKVCQKTLPNKREYKEHMNVEHKNEAKICEVKVCQMSVPLDR